MDVGASSVHPKRPEPAFLTAVASSQMGNSFEHEEKNSATRVALRVVIANVDADCVAHLAVACKVLRDDARCVPCLMFGPSSKVWHARKDTPPDTLGVPGHADAIVAAVVTRHRPGRLKRLVLCPPAEAGGQVFTAPWSRGMEKDWSDATESDKKSDKKIRAVLPATLTFCADASSALFQAWVEPRATRLNENARTSGARGVIPVDKVEVSTLVTRGLHACTMVPRVCGTAGLFTPNLTRLAVGGAASVSDDDVRVFFRACPALRALDICEASDDLTGKNWWSKESPDTQAQVPNLERLRFARCASLRGVNAFAPKLSDLAVTECPKFISLEIDGGDGIVGPLPTMRHAVFGDFRPAEDYRGCVNVSRRFTLPAFEALSFIKRCAFLETVSIPASAVPEPGEGSTETARSRFIADWSDALRDRAGTLKVVCVQFPLSVFDLDALLANVAPSLPRLAELYFAVSTSPPGGENTGTEANAVANSLVAIVNMCPSLRKLTIVDPGPVCGPETTPRASARASLELTRGALLARCRLPASASPLAIDVTLDFHDEAAGVWLGTADSRERDGLEGINAWLEEDARTRTNK